ncbi:hypothetical protein ABOM_002158 [Aspergillus bombycis]|uniref:P-loop containing nucleoside triphosphate hydrolase protein n=1 Tax=Aspergillus bombycis TaxID=109264 RepID=A0A1F8A948_9EURO|nr:hypothetical protein ABOM_002158 [Aspergillus bombycis]OGM48290.1 hypothetical protein ABOM_002158 [Aspergillus bombycis]
MDFLERWVYNRPTPANRTRDRPMKVLALGMSRSGTESLSRALRILGYDHVFHGFEMFENTPMLWRSWTMLGRRKWGSTGPADGTAGITREDFDRLLGHCEAITDQPGSLFAPELIAAYPEAKVILNRRDVDTWYPSLCTVVRPLTTGVFYHVLPWFNADLYWEAQYVQGCLKPFFHGSWEQHGKWVYEQHSATIRGLVPPDRFLEWTVQDGWEPLCRFLEKDVPAEEFPNGNTVDKALGAHNNNVGECIAAAVRNLAISVVCVGVAVAYGLGARRVDWRQCANYLNIASV